MQTTTRHHHAEAASSGPASVCTRDAQPERCTDERAHQSTCASASPGARYQPGQSARPIYVRGDTRAERDSRLGSLLRLGDKGLLIAKQQRNASHIPEALGTGSSTGLPIAWTVQGTTILRQRHWQSQELELRFQYDCWYTVYTLKRRSQHLESVRSFFASRTQSGM